MDRNILAVLQKLTKELGNDEWLKHSAEAGGRLGPRSVPDPEKFRQYMCMARDFFQMLGDDLKADKKAIRLLVDIGRASVKHPLGILLLLRYPQNHKILNNSTKQTLDGF